MKWTKTVLAIGIAICASVVVGMVVKYQFPHVKDSYFDPDKDKLRQLPANLDMMRPTHFPHSLAKVRHIHGEDSIIRTLGRNASLRQAIAEAYDCDLAQVVLPPDAPKGGFDFLVTTPENTREELQSTIRKTLGYTAQRETQGTDFYALKVGNASLPGFTPSPNSEESDVSMKEGKLYFTHQQLNALLDGLSQGLNQPVVDQTGSTNYYDFSMAWNQKAQESMQSSALDPDKVSEFLARMGLRLEQETGPMDVLVVQKAR
ncbi:MAG TPA: TIGR03435 family protein [Verrucomicrobiae bacterium]|jgi:uncharacterized protein (TIGR03435 family)